MNTAVVFYFDEETDNKIMDLWRKLYARDICREMIDTGSRPHISIAAFDDASIDAIEERVKEYAKAMSKLEISLTSISCFPGDAGVIYLAPKASTELLEQHQRFYEYFKDVNDSMHKIYSPTFWVPHCTMTLGISREKVMEGMELLLSEFRQMKGKLSSIGFVEFYPINYRHDKTILLKE